MDRVVTPLVNAKDVIISGQKKEPLAERPIHNVMVVDVTIAVLRQVQVNVSHKEGAQIYLLAEHLKNERLSEKIEMAAIMDVERFKPDKVLLITLIASLNYVDVEPVIGQNHVINVEMVILITKMALKEHRLFTKPNVTMIENLVATQKRVIN